MIGSDRDLEGLGKLRLLLLTVCLILATPVCVWADEDGRAAEIRRIIELYGTHGEFSLPQLDSDKIQAIARGESVVLAQAISENGDEVSSLGLVGIQLVDSPRKAVWLAMLGATKRADKRLTRAILARGSPGSYTRYQHINLPWPFRDRHWVIHCSKDTSVAERTGGLFWEHRWQLDRNGLELVKAAVDSGKIPELNARQIDKSIYINANQGAWITAETSDNQTLVFGVVAADLGGFFPKPLVKSFTRNRLSAGLQNIKALSEIAMEAYAGNPVIADGFAEPIAPFHDTHSMKAQ